MKFWTAWPDRLLSDVSLWSANLAALGAEIKRMEPYADLFHLDVADAHFVPGLLFFSDLIEALRPWTNVPFHVHLMTEHPTEHIPAFVEAGANLITVHYENGAEAATAIEQIHQRGLAAGLALQLKTPPEVVVPYLDEVQLILLMGTSLGVKGQSLDPSTFIRLQTIRHIVRTAGYEGQVKIGVDGGIREQTVSFLRQAGADLVVPGSLVFKSDQLAQTFQWLHVL
jgi:ribulose-phosphate 3-epimerase